MSPHRTPHWTPHWTRRGALVALALVAGAARAQSAAEAPEVLRVVVRSEADLDAEEIEPLLAVHLGEPLDRERVRATLRNLRLAGVASEVELYSRAIEGGLEIEIVLRPDLAVDELAIAGESGLSYPKLLAVLPQRQGQPLREDRVLRGIYRIEELLRAEGWSGAKARIDVTPLPGGRAVRVVYRVEAGPRRRVGAVRFEGLAPLAPAKALEAVAARPGEPLRPAAVKEDVERLERWLAKNGYRRARVAAAEEQERASAQGPVVDLVWRLERGPRFEFELVGAERKPLEKRGLLSFLGDEPFDESLLLASAAAIEEDYQRRGHYRVEVREQLVEKGDVVAIRLEIVPGARYSLAEVRFEGNASFDAERLERLLHTSPKRLLQLERGRLVDSEVAEDLTNLRSFYALNGYDQARILPARVEEIGPGELAVVFPIEEGRRLTTGTVTVTGAVSVSSERLGADLPLVPGGAFHRLLLDTSVETIRGRLEELGHRAAIVEARVRWDESERVADVVFEVLEGQRATIEAVVVRGNQTTKTAVVRRFVDLTPGDPLSTRRLLDAQRALYRLGIFSKVDVRAPRAGGGSEPSEVVVEVEEGRVRAVAYGLGYDTESGARGLFRFSHLNLLGRAYSIQLDSLVAQREQLYRARYRQPYLGRWPVELTTTLYQQLETRPDFDVQREGGQVGVERPYGSLRVGLFAEYRLVDLETEAPDSVVPRESRNAHVASLTPTAIWERRDDPIDPTRGWNATLQLERAFPFADADADYQKLFGQLALYRPVGRGTLALSLRAGGLWPQATGPDPDAPAIDQVPAAELFYAGGRTTHRAFARDELGIVGETIVLDDSGEPISVGGGALALINLEWRVPIAGAFGVNLFVDGGNVWREVEDFDDSLRWGAGLGLRYASPVGPLRVEIGWKLDREPFEDPYEAFISLGNAF